MKILCFVNKFNGIVERVKKLSDDITIASFNPSSLFADFVPSDVIEEPFEGAAFIEKVKNLADPDLVIFSDETLIKESASVFAGRNNLGLISHSSDIYMKDGKIIGRVPGWENLSAEVYSLTLPLIVLKGVENINLPERVHREVDISGTESRASLIKTEKREKNPLEDARVIVGVGRGVKAGVIKEVQEFAKKINAEIGCTRPIADMGLLPNFRMIGDSGISVHPEIYIALGISGAIQHLSGVNAKYIIAVNTDPRAPIFTRSALSINKSVEETLPEVEKWLKNFS